MAFQISFTRKALSDVMVAEKWVVEVGKGSLARWRTKFYRAIEALERDPNPYALSDEAERFGKPVREWHFGKYPHIYRIFFTIEGTSVVIHRLRHAAQDSISEDDL